MRRSLGKILDCEPADRVDTYRVKIRKPSRSTPKAKVTLVPAQLKTPRADRNLSDRSKNSSRTKRIEQLLQSGDLADGRTLQIGAGSFLDANLFVPFDLEMGNSNQNRPNDYLRNWKENKQKEYLEEIISRAASDVGSGCSKCRQACDIVWRCRDCFAKPVLCTTCCRVEHAHTPFHRVEVWNETHFATSWLWRTGLVIDLCKARSCSLRSTTPWVPIPDPNDPSYGAKPDWRTWEEFDLLVVVHSNGVHHIPVHFCTCADAPPDELQLLRHDLYPASHKDVRTAFTFTVLDEYLLQNLECYTSALHFYSKLRRLTNEVFPRKVPDRYRELLRCGREWRILKDLKRFGFGHTGWQPKEGELALFCAACPQDGINLPADWRSQGDQWRFSMTLVADGNFTLVHRKQKGEDDVWLRNGEGYLVETSKYDEHLKKTTEPLQVSTCHEHRAVEDRSKVHKGCDVTGVGALACSRHGAFAPSSVVGFQKGERQVNMDYGLMGAVRSTRAENAPRLNLLYDINCQYSVHLRDRFATSDTLSLSEDLPIVFGIGKFHVFGHQEGCYSRYSPSFIDGIGQTSGEILESLWSTLNESARATQTMSLAHRTEVLDAHIGDSNWKKMISLGRNLSVAYPKALKELHEAEEAFSLLDATASESQRIIWEEQLSNALEKRAQEGDVSAMDILNVSIQKPPTRAKVQHDLMLLEQRSDQQIGVTSWITLGFKIQEAQLAVKAYRRGLPRPDLWTDNQNLELVRKQEHLRNEITHFLETGASLFPQVDMEEYAWVNPPETNPVIEGSEEDFAMEVDCDNPFLEGDRDPEDMEIPLPSSFARLPESMKSAATKEIKLRVAQANDALEAIRTDIGHKSFLYRSNIRLAEGKKEKTRGYSAVKAVNQSMRHQIRLYNHARWALRRLNASHGLLEKYKDLKPEHTKAITAIYHPNAPGQSKTVFSWIWNLDVSGDSQKAPYLEELYRINWLRAKCRMERWREEVVLLKEEMTWICNFFKYKEDTVRSWATLGPDKPGYRAYAEQQAGVWWRLRADGDELFRKTRAAGEDLIRQLRGDGDN
ncbi:hypothetical protein CC1G_15494 [Coprinopsis cinerea okayama7|uniref:CxC2-like cysteine cluster KDZ transposase-associated domain-containing protein n=1 Tax=Coprinopsis cinerea (strain Okayama-7 / 130 / ATCC MYA-4618 / FGSC 9003) TaxID=240176 RepID=D6RN39_COPC7|nr:hypothetical protein CC1G_15494 [Coprinopsis cinerea okayama7\|eukprot:XP_002910954.1 hypothetical protein CC1G_15494 [Coprinopsis cinerea okayama7\